MNSIALSSMRERLQAIAQSLAESSWWTKGLLSAFLGLAAFRAWRSGRLSVLTESGRKREEASEPGLFKKHSTFESFTTASGFVYPRIRVFHYEHSQAGKLPKDLPLLVFMHGLGGNATQFAPLLTSLVNVAPCLAIELPGCGLSDFRPDAPEAYTTAAFAELLCSAIERYHDAESNQQVVLVGHSMGCSIAALLASSASPLQARLGVNYIIGFVAICPRTEPPSAAEAANVDRLRWVPTFVFDVLRFLDQRGGLDSPSVTRVVGEGADTETKKLQQNYNGQSKSAVVLRFVTAGVPSPGTSAAKDGIPWPGKEVWSSMKIPLFLLAGEADQITPPEQIEQVTKWLTSQSAKAEPLMPAESVAATEAEQRSREVMAGGLDEKHDGDGQSSGIAKSTGTIPTAAGDMQLAQEQLSNGDATAGDIHPSRSNSKTADTIKDDHASTKHNFVLKTTILPAPAAHGLMYATSTVRITSGLIEGFLAKHVDERLSLGWQLQHLTTSGKWDVKNLTKWKSVDSCSAPIGGVFRAMKTMREVDDTHNPTEFVKRFSSRVIPDGVAMVVDISHESPVYNPEGLEQGGVEYHKFPTVSKLPPTADEVEHFISLIDQLRRSLKLALDDRGDSAPHVTAAIATGELKPPQPTIGIHCHYGFNRTGFFIVCYLVERLGYRLQDAVAEFAEKRTPGIKHDHFVNELFVRYAVKIERRGTVVGIE